MTRTAVAADPECWGCYHCGKTFVHARLLAGHLLDFHGEAR